MIVSIVVTLSWLTYAVMTCYNILEDVSYPLVIFFIADLVLVFHTINHIHVHIKSYSAVQNPFHHKTFLSQVMFNSGNLG